MNDEEKLLEMLQKEIDMLNRDINTMPLEEFDNLSPNDMHVILYDTLEEGSPIQYKPDIQNKTLQKIPFLTLFRDYLAIVENMGEMKLTAKGNLPRKVCHELYGKGLIKERYIDDWKKRIHKEADSPILKTLKVIGQLSGCTKKRNNKISLTSKGKKLFSAPDQSKLFRTLFETFAFKFNLGYNDLYKDEFRVQHTIGYTFYLLLRYGKELRKVDFYVDKNLEAFPHLLEPFASNWGPPKKQYESCYEVRVFERFLAWFGFVEITRERQPDRWREIVSLKATDLFYEIFEIKKENFKFKKSENLA